MKPDEIIVAALKIIEFDPQPSAHDESRVIIDALDAAGYVIAPKEPTRAMAVRGAVAGGTTDVAAMACYDAMLFAKP